MSISRIEIQGQISRAQDYTAIKHNEDHKGAVDQNNFQNQFHKAVDSKLNQVHQGDNTENFKKRHDAKEKGNGQYAGDGGRHRRHGSENEEDSGERVMLKGFGSFDIKI